MSEIKKVVLAYSGGLDTSIIIPWLKEHYDNCEVIAVCGNVGQKGELEGLEERAKASGASKLYIEDLTDEFVEDYVVPTMQAGADYEGYLLGTSFARPILAKRVVEIARAEGADAVCHGSTGKGNDQVRFELAIMHFAPDLKIITPWREWDIQSRDDEIDYAEAHHIPLKISRETNYSKDKNLWHLSHEGLDLEDPGNEPQYDKPGFLELGVSPKTAPDKSEFVELEFEKGVPVSLNGEKLKPAVLIAKLNEIGGRNGIGLYDVVENRLVGMKSRGVYETPGGTILYKAHEVLETLTLDKLTAHKKRELAITFGELVGLRWPVVQPPAQGPERLCHLYAGACHRQGASGTVQGQPHQRRCLVAVFPLPGGHCHLCRRRRLQAERCHRFHQHLRPAHQGAGHCKQRKRR